MQTNKTYAYNNGKKVPLPLQSKPMRYAQTEQTKLQPLANTVNNGKYAIQLGAFSDYKRAKSYANDMKNDLAKKYALYDIEVEETSVASGKMYRSKLVGMAKGTADKICRNLNSRKKSCLVVAQNNTSNWASK